MDRHQYGVFANVWMAINIFIMIPVMQNRYRDQLLRKWFRKSDYSEQLIKNQVARALQSASNKRANRSKQEK